MTLRAITFDFWSTLVDGNITPERTAQRLARLHRAIAQFKMGDSADLAALKNLLGEPAANAHWIALPKPPANPTRTLGHPAAGRCWPGSSGSRMG